MLIFLHYEDDYWRQNDLICIGPHVLPIVGFDVGRHCKASYNNENNKKGN